MQGSKPDLNIAKNIKIIEWLKNQLLQGVSELFISIYKGNKEKIVNALADTFIACYLLARRLGITYLQLENAVEQKVERSKDKGHEIEDWYGDLSSLLEHLETRRKR